MSIKLFCKLFQKNFISKKVLKLLVVAYSIYHNDHPYQKKFKISTLVFTFFSIFQNSLIVCDGFSSVVIFQYFFLRAVKIETNKYLFISVQITGTAYKVVLTA